MTAGHADGEKRMMFPVSMVSDHAMSWGCRQVEEEVCIFLGLESKVGALPDARGLRGWGWGLGSGPYWFATFSRASQV